MRFAFWWFVVFVLLPLLEPVCTMPWTFPVLR